MEGSSTPDVTRKADAAAHFAPLFPLTPDAVRGLRTIRMVKNGMTVRPAEDNKKTTHEPSALSHLPRR